MVKGEIGFPLLVGIIVILGVTINLCLVLVQNVQIVTFIVYLETVSGIGLQDLFASSNIINTLNAFGGPLSLGISLLDVFSPYWWLKYHILVYLLLTL
ncbi:MAG: hypothetical protein Q6366_004205 [Candidatus Freyarchaeota archaeon]